MKTSLCHNRNERGNTLMASLLLAAALSTVVLVATSNTFSSSTLSRTAQNQSRAQTAAEYGAEVAISQMMGGLVFDTDAAGNPTVAGDWIYGREGESLFRVNGAQAPDERRISGIYDDQEFRVQVRSARLAFENATKTGSWLRRPDTKEPASGEEYSFGDVYEITSTARFRDGTGTGTNPLTTAVVRAVVDFKHVNDMDKLVNESSAINNELPGNFQVAGNFNLEPDLSNAIESGLIATKPGEDGEAETPDIPFEEVYNVKISGEDHYLTKYFIEDVKSNKIVTPLKLFTNEANYFGALGGYWTSGCLTLNYQIDPNTANPFRPRTPAFSSSAKDREMKAMIPSLPPDTYLLGGKQSKTVTLDDNNRINETNTNQANAGGNFNVVLGAFEDLMNLYINMAGITASNAYPNNGAFEDASQWFRMYIGQYTEYARKSTANATSLPLYKGTRVRAQTLHVIKNENEEILVREYEHKSNGKLYDYPASNTTWKGNYTWAKVHFTNSDGGKFVFTNNTSRVAVPRVFMWQELVGYSLEKRADGHPKLRTDGTKRTIFRLDGDGNRIPVGFDENFQKYAESNVNYAMTDRFDTINVRQSDGSLKPHTTMDDFLFEKDFGTDKDGTQVKRQALAVFIGYEDQREHQADYNYSDMMFTIYIAPEQKEQIKNEAILSQTSEHWWERDEEDGLTGNFSRTAISTNLDPSTYNSETPLKDNYDLLAHGPKDEMDEHIYSMLNESDNSITKFPRARFVTDTDNFSTGVLLSELVQEYADLGIFEFYYSKSDIMDYIQRDPLAYYVEGQGLDLEKALNEIKALNPAVTLKEMEERWDHRDIQKTDLVDNEPSSYTAEGKDLLIRSLAGSIVGFRTQSVPAVKTADFTRLSNSDLGIPSHDQFPEPTQLTLGFLAGEHLQSTLANETDHLVSVGHIPVRDDAMTQPSEPEGEANTYVKALLEATPEAAVAKCYVDYYAATPDIKEEVQGMYGLKEERYSIGFHRAGNDVRFAERHMQDHYEIVLLGIDGYNPYRETVSDGKRYIAQERRSQAEATKYDTAFKYAADADYVPDFVFDKPIDGAGTMVVNGNLVIEDDFAYHGILVVLGDVIVRPTLREHQLVYGKDGNPIDKYGNSLYLSQDLATWMYAWSDPDDETRAVLSEYYLDEDGKKILDENGVPLKVIPLRQSRYRGHLTVQGALFTKGRIITESTPNVLVDSSVAAYTHGKLTVFWSLDAVREAAGSWSQSNNYLNRISWSQNNDLDVNHIWNNTLE